MIAIPILFSLALLILDLVHNRKIYSPGVVFNGITFVTLFLYSFRLSDIQQVLSVKTLVLLTLCIFAFNLPVFIGYFMKKPQKNVVDKTNKVAPVNYETSKRTDFILFIIILTLFLIDVIYNKGFPLLWKLLKNGKTYFDFGMPLLHPIFACLLILVGAYSLFKKKCPYKWFYLLVPILIISRHFLIAMVVEGFIIYVISAKNKPKFFWIYLCVAAVIGVAVFGIIGNFRTGKSEFLAVAQFKSWASWLPSSIKWVYSYLCFSISNLNNLISMTPGFVNFGASSLNSVFHSIFLLPENETFNYLVSPNFTVSTFAPSLYLDFGLLGPVMFCLVIGVISIFAYQRLEYSHIYVLWYAVILYGIIFLYFVNMFLYAIIVAQILFVPIIFVLPKKIQGWRKR